MVNCEELTNAGIDMDNLLRRLMGNEALVKVFIRKFMEDKTYVNLLNAFSNQDMKQAEMMSHTLKGMCGNLSLNALYALFTDQVNLIRAQEYEQAEAMMPKISDTYNKAIVHMRAWLEA